MVLKLNKKFDDPKYNAREKSEFIKHDGKEIIK